MAVRSNIDLAFFICVMDVSHGDIPESARTAFEREEDSQLQTLVAPFTRTMLDKDTHLHESIHLWQALNLPFVYWSSFRAFQGVLRTFNALDHNFPDLHAWNHDHPGVLRLLSERVYPYRFVDHFELHMRDRGPMAGGERFPPFSPLTLLETAASVMQWALTRCVAPTPAVAFSRWSKREGGYRAMVDYLCKLVGDEDLALDMYLPLCNAAFGTFNPVSAFILAASQYVVKHKSSLRANAATYRNRIERILDETRQHSPNREQFAHPRRLSEIDVSLVDLPPHRLTLRDVVDMTFGERAWPHPTLYTLAKRWMAEAHNRPDMRILLNDPARISDSTIEYLLDAYQPVILVRYRSPTRTRAVPVMRQGDLDYVGRVERLGPGIDGPTAMRDLYTMFGAVRRAVGIYYDETTRLCGHAECPEYSFNYCNTWMFIPEHYGNCTFPSSMEDMRKSFRQLKEKEHATGIRPH